MKLHRTVLLKISEPNKGKLRKLKLTIELYHKVLLFYLDVILRLGMYRIASMSNKEALSFLERHTVSTKAHPAPKFPIFSGVQTNIRRSAINKAVGMVKSYLSNLYRWHKEGKELGHKKPSYPNPKRSSLIYYATDVQFKDVLKSSGGIPFVRLKVVDEEGKYVFVNYPVKPYRWFYERIDYLEKEGFKLKNTATLIEKDGNFYIALLFEKKVSRLSRIKRPEYLLSVDLNVQRNLACIGVYHLNWKTKKAELLKIGFLNGELTRLCYKRDYLLHELRLKQTLTGRKPASGDNKHIWQKIRHLNKDIALKAASEINRLVQELGTKKVTVVFEKLKGLRGKKKKKARSLNRKLNFWLRKAIVERVRELSLEHGYKIFFVYPYKTSKQCSRCGALGERFSPNGSKALFRCPVCGYTINADVNAIFNIAFLALSHLLHAGGKEVQVVTFQVSLKSHRWHNLSGACRAMAIPCA